MFKLLVIVSVLLSTSAFSSDNKFVGDIGCLMDWQIEDLEEMAVALDEHKQKYKLDRSRKFYFGGGVGGFIYSSLSYSSSPVDVMYIFPSDLKFFHEAGASDEFITMYSKRTHLYARSTSLSFEIDYVLNLLKEHQSITPNHLIDFYVCGIPITQPSMEIPTIITPYIRLRQFENHELSFKIIMSYQAKAATNDPSSYGYGPDPIDSKSLEDYFISREKGISHELARKILTFPILEKMPDVRMYQYFR